MKLLLNEMFSAEIAIQLRRRGHDVLAVNERRDFWELPDPDLFQAAQAEQRILVTENGSHFLRLDRTYRQQGESHHGLILTTHHRFDRRGSRGIGQLVLALDALLRTREGWPTGNSPIHWLR